MANICKKNSGYLGMSTLYTLNEKNMGTVKVF